MFVPTRFLYEVKLRFHNVCRNICMYVCVRNVRLKKVLQQSQMKECLLTGNPKLFQRRERDTKKKKKKKKHLVGFACLCCL